MQLLEPNGLLEKRIAILSGSTIGDIKDILEIFLLNFGIKPQFYIGQYNRFYEDIMFGNQELADNTWEFDLTIEYKSKNKYIELGKDTDQ
jgi:hypothetical protein